MLYLTRIVKIRCMAIEGTLAIFFRKGNKSIVNSKSSGEEKDDKETGSDDTARVLGETILLIDDDQDLQVEEDEDPEELLSDPNAWVELADAEKEDDVADDDIFGVLHYTDLCKECSAEVIEAFQKSYRSKGNNSNVRFFGTSRRTHFRKKASLKKLSDAAACSKRIDGFFMPACSSTDDHVAARIDDGEDFWFLLRMPRIFQRSSGWSRGDVVQNLRGWGAARWLVY